MIWPTRANDAHKGDCGRIGLIVGSPPYTGAALLSARAAFRVGAGYVVVMTHPNCVSTIQSSCPEAITLPCQTHDDATQIIEKYRLNHLLIGPGLGAMATTFLSLPAQSRIIDADALVPNLPTWPAQTAILTPHKGEYTRCFGDMPVDKAAATINQVIIHKGPHSAITNGTTTTHNLTGNPGMATAGSGDVLAGILIGLLGQGLSPLEAAQTGTYLHGKAGDLAASNHGNGLMASDIIDKIGPCLPTSHPS